MQIEIKMAKMDNSDTKRAISEVAGEVDKAKVAADGMGVSLEAAWAKLKTRTMPEIVGDMKAVVSAFREIQGSASASAIDVGRAQDAMKQRLKELATLLSG